MSLGKLITTDRAGVCHLNLHDHEAKCYDSFRNGEMCIVHFCDNLMQMGYLKDLKYLSVEEQVAILCLLSHMT